MNFGRFWLKSSIRNIATSKKKKKKSFSWIRREICTDQPCLQVKTVQNKYVVGFDVRENGVEEALLLIMDYFSLKQWFEVKTH